MIQTMTQLGAGGPVGTLVLAEAVVLISWWKAIVLFLPFIGWAWIVSTIYDKHALRFHLPRESWNLAHLVAGLAALILGLGIPAMAGLDGLVGFAVALGLVLVVLGIDIAAYPAVANKDERVPPEHHVRLNFDAIKESRAAKAETKQAGRAELKIISADKSLVEVPNNDTPEFAVRVASERIVLEALEAHATQIDLLPASREGAYAVSLLIDGVRSKGEPLPPADAAKVMDFWKQCAGLAIDDRRRLQKGDLQIERHEVKTPIHLTTQGGQGGMRLTMLLNPAKQVRRKIEDMGLLDNQLEDLQALVDEGLGVVLLSAPPDNGRTTLMYRVVKMHDAYTRNVQTIELDIQDSLEGIRQNLFDPTDQDQEFSKLVRSIFRRDPDVVAIAELDSDAASEIASADLDRVRAYPLLKEDGALPAIQRWVKLVGDPKTASEGLKGVVAGKVMRTLCTNCRVAYQPTPEMLKKLGLPADRVKQLFKVGGQVMIKNKPEVCPVCAGRGYFGQTGIFEVYPLGPDERSLIAQGNLPALRTELRKRPTPTIQQAALRKAVEGVTSVEEVLRVTAQESKKSKKPAPSKPATTPSGA